ncbi:MAG: nuclear transport factor 2 family protein [Gammaproteobacteria bacterium]|nr:nuclear transport factor 2 family protein [Gammaproteobacteria bacterium]
MLMPVLPLVRAVLLGATLVCTSPARAQASSADAAGVQAVVDAFRAALRSGDTGTVQHLLAADAAILEGGAIETRDQYLSHHLMADMEFAKAVPSEVRQTAVTINGDTAWVRSTSTASGSYRDRPVRLAGAELIVLTRKESSWEIRAIQWSAREVK